MFWVSLVSAINVLVASGFAIAGLVNPQSILPAGSLPTEASSIFAMYAAGRTIPLAIFVLIAIYRHSTPAILVLGTLAGIVQLLDAAVGLAQHDVGKTIGPLLIAVVQLYTMFLLRKRTRTRRQD
jgi:hypothetical protein